MNRCHAAIDVLMPGQRAPAGRAAELIRGLIDSAGCRVAANDRAVRPNRWDDVRGLVTAALDTLGIPWTRPRLDEFVGPKS